MAEILLVDDEAQLLKSYRRLLESEGYAVRTAPSGEKALAAFAERRPDLVVLDMMMPGMNGIAVCKEIRRVDKLTPIVFFTCLNSDVTHVRGMDLGADDYVAKDSSPEIVLAHIRAALRRSALCAAPAAESPRRVALGRVTVDLATLTVTGPERHAATLTATEARLFEELLAHRGEYVSNDDLFTALHGSGFVGDVTKVRNHISTLRAKLGVARDMISNSPSAGYRLAR